MYSRVSLLISILLITPIAQGLRVYFFGDDIYIFCLDQDAEFDVITGSPFYDNVILVSGPHQIESGYMLYDEWGNLDFPTGLTHYYLIDCTCTLLPTIEESPEEELLESSSDSEADTIDDDEVEYETDCDDAQFTSAEGFDSQTETPVTTLPVTINSGIGHPTLLGLSVSGISSALSVPTDTNKPREKKPEKEICQRYLKEKCYSSNCKFRHPYCRDFLNDKCTKTDCKFPHTPASKLCVAYCTVCKNYGHGAKYCRHKDPHN